MNLEKHISRLLFEHDCVIVPGFGGFVCNTTSAAIRSGKFYPPFKKISFNRNLKNNDGLLANEVAQQEGITYVEANQSVSAYIDVLNKQLTANGRFDLKYIGTFYSGKENTLLFEQDENVNYLQESFGATVFYSPVIKREPIERKIEKQLKDKVIIPSKEKAAAESIRRTFPVRKYMAVAASFVAVLSLVFVSIKTDMLSNVDLAGMNPFGPKDKPLYQVSENPLPGDDNTIDNISHLIASATRKDTTRYLNILIDGHIPIVLSLGEEKSSVTKAKKRLAQNHYHVIGGAFAIAENADKFRQKLVKLGYDAGIIERKLQFVSYGSYATREEALQAIERIRAVQKDVWLMTN